MRFYTPFGVMWIGTSTHTVVWSAPTSFLYALRRDVDWDDDDFFKTTKMIHVSIRPSA